MESQVHAQWDVPGFAESLRAAISRVYIYYNLRAITSAPDRANLTDIAGLAGLAGITGITIITAFVWPYCPSYYTSRK